MTLPRIEGVTSCAKNLNLLKISNNLFGDVPQEIESLKSLVHLDMQNNNLLKLPNFLGSLSLLKRVNIQGNPLDIELRRLNTQKLKTVLRENSIRNEIRLEKYSTLKNTNQIK